MKKTFFVIFIVVAVGFLSAEARFKLGITDYDPNIRDFKFDHGIYRLHTRADFINLYREYGVGTNINISFKSDNHDVDYVNHYDLYAHKFHASVSSKGTYMMYGIYGGFRMNYLKTYSSGFHGKANYRYSRLLCGAAVSRNHLGFELMITQNLEHEWKFDWYTKYQFRGTYYVEFMVSSNSPMATIPDEVSVTFGLELLQ